jgi:hypothetical protein
LVGSGAVWEPVVGYSRAVRVGQWVSVAGTTAAADGGGAVGAQARIIPWPGRSAGDGRDARANRVVEVQIGHWPGRPQRRQRQPRGSVGAMVSAQGGLR